MVANPFPFLVLLATVLALLALLVFLIVRLVSISRRMAAAERGSETALMTGALQEAVARMRMRERSQADRADESERLSDQIIDNLPSGLLVADAGGHPQRINPAGARLLGVEAGAVASLWRDLGSAGAPLRTLIDDCLANATPSPRRTLRIEAADGSRRHLGAGVSLIRDKAGEVTGVICLFTDLTAVVDLEEQLRLKDSISRLGELTAGLAHEFRNGLATIHGYARLMEADAPTGRHGAYVRSLREETESLTGIVANFLAFAKPADDTRSATPLAPIVERAIDDVAADAEGQGGGITSEGAFGDIEADDVLLRQALSNLLRNGVEACVESGRVPRIVVSGAIDRAAGTQRVTIADNGPGVPDGLREKIFRPFFTTRGSGTGLGLALVQKIVVSHNGRISVGVSPDGGAEFAIVIPLAQRRN